MNIHAFLRQQMLQQMMIHRLKEDHEAAELRRVRIEQRNAMLEREVWDAFLMDCQRVLDADD